MTAIGSRLLEWVTVSIGSGARFLQTNIDRNGSIDL
jgi:hypothetical protein